MMPNDHNLPPEAVSHVEIDPTQLDAEMTQLSASVAYWNTRLARAIAVEERAKDDIVRIEAEARERVRAASQGAKMTVADFDAAIALDTSVIAAHNEYTDAREDAGVTRAVTIALSVKRDMLMQLGAMLRAEMEADPATRSNMAEAREQRTAELKKRVEAHFAAKHAASK